MALDVMYYLMAQSELPPKQNIQIDPSYYQNALKKTNFDPLLNTSVFSKNEYNAMKYHYINPDLFRREIFLLYQAFLADERFIEQELTDYETGIDVHKGKREHRTVEACRLLQKITGDINVEEIRVGVGAFTAYLMTYSDAVKRNKALYALSAPKESANDPWGPLLSYDEVGRSILINMVDSYSIAGDELIARLWIYTETLAEKEKELARVSMVEALYDSYENGVRACNHGRKIQALIIRVLQGRLKDVNIDQMSVMTPENLFALFFVDVRHTVLRGETLLQAAQKFVTENPIDNPEVFMSLIRKYEKEESLADEDMNKQTKEFAQNVYAKVKDLKRPEMIHGIQEEYSKTYLDPFEIFELIKATDVEKSAIMRITRMNKTKKAAAIFLQEYKDVPFDDLIREAETVCDSNTHYDKNSFLNVVQESRKSLRG